MTTTAQFAPTSPRSISNKQLWTGRAISVLCIFLLMDSIMKIVKAQPAVEGTLQLGYPESTLVPMGVALLVSTLLYAIRRTSILGAILITGYLGGAVATNLRVGASLFGN